MIKKLTLITLCLAVAACAAPHYPFSDCPWVTIPRDKAYMIQKVNFADDFQIELTGYEGYCYYDADLDRRTAYINPQFKIYRLQSNDETRVDFNFYAQTVDGPPELVGKRIYPVSVEIAENELEKDFTGRQIRVLLPTDGTRMEITLALDVSPAQYRYNQQTFDIRYRYNLPETQLIERTFIVNPAGTSSETDPTTDDLTVIESVTTPSQNKSGCSSCAL